MRARENAGVNPFSQGSRNPAIVDVMKPLASHESSSPHFVASRRDFYKWNFPSFVDQSLFIEPTREPITLISVRQEDGDICPP